jgi:BirA family biotin operon repressor/biotin-[acetyl-CoA-carboxylase] ligase
VRVAQHDTIDSTNEEARRLAASGETGPLWITAHEQTAGRARRGRDWISNPGNLYATLLLPPEGPVEQRAQLSLVAGVAAAEAVAAFADNVALKWPNDVLIGGEKVAGLLLESFGGAVAIGFGVNLAHAPNGTEFPATSIAALTKAPAPDEALAELARQWDAWYDIWRHQGFAPVRIAWLARAHGLGEGLRVRLSDGEMTGTFVGLDNDGALLLRRDDGIARVTAGDVFPGV